MRRFGDPCRPDIRYRERHGAYAAILRGRMMLLAATPNEGETFLLPGGGIDPGESPLRALHREVWEETGWSAQPLRRLGFFQQYRYMPDYGIWARKVCHIYLCRAGRRLSAPLEPDHSPIWMHVDEAAHRLSVAGERNFVARLAASMRRKAP